MTDAELLALSDAAFARLVNEALKALDRRSFLKLSRSPLAHTSLVTPALVLDALSPTPDDRGRALYVVLQWGVNRLAPTLPRYPLGTSRPFSDPTWQEPLWWRYNILRHRYLDPLDPEHCELVNGEASSVVQALLALTGMQDPGQYYAERARAIEDVARLLYMQLRTHQADDELCNLALAQIYDDLRGNPEALALMELAATFRHAFPRALLQDMAQAEGQQNVTATLHYLQKQRLLQEGDGGTRLWMSPRLQRYLHARQSAMQHVRRHRRALLHYRAYGPPLEAVWHLHMAGQPIEAAALLLEVAPQLIGELQAPDLRDALLMFDAKDLPQSLWLQVQQLLCDVQQQLGAREAALGACRAALKAAETQVARARVYRRLGKLYEDHSQAHALEYYRRAIENFAETDTELVDALKDRAWIYIHRQAWTQAEADLQRGLDLAAPHAWRQQADIHTALASLYRQQARYPEALTHAREALTLREERGDYQLAAESWSNIALIYAQTGEISAAMAAYEEALATFEKLGHREAIAIVKLNMGMALQLAGQLEAAITHYEACLEAATALNIPLLRSKACSNLVEVHAQQRAYETARRYWQQGQKLSLDAGLEGELTWYASLLEEFPALTVGTTAFPDAPAAVPPGDFAIAGHKALSPEAHVALKLAQSQGHVTNRALRKATHISKPTATRKLAHLVDLGLLHKRGQGRGVHYVLAEGVG